MASTLETLKNASIVSIGSGVKRPVEMAENNSAAINQMIGKIFTTRNLVHFAHWATNSFAAHEALGDLYEDIVKQVDEIVEVYQGKHGLLTGLSCPAADMPLDIFNHIVNEQGWICENKRNIANGCEAVENLIDELDAAYLKIIYKLKNLK
jgi:hypothetical protein